MDNINIFEFGIKLIICLYLYAVLKNYDYIKEMLKVSEIDNKSMLLDNYLIDIQASEHDTKILKKNVLIARKNKLIQLCTKHFTNKSQKQIQLMVEKYLD
jgi:hypothetical protein